MRCTCRGGDSDPCALCQACERWLGALSEAERDQLASQFIAEFTGAVSGQRFDTVADAFDRYLAEHFALHVYGCEPGAGDVTPAGVFMAALSRLTGFEVAA